jgi:hypothetical protein
LWPFALCIVYDLKLAADWAIPLTLLGAGYCLSVLWLGRTKQRVCDEEDINRRWREVVK